MKKQFFLKLTFLLVFHLSCNKENIQDLNYFNFDTLEHYYKEISTDDLTKEHEKKRKDPNYNSINFKILEEGYPIKIDNSFINELSKLGFKKRIVSNSKYNYIKDFFSKKNCNELKSSACAPVYRDILIFKKEDKIIGIAKICFRCETSYIIGTKKNWDYFGECGGYQKLQEIIK